MHSRSLKLREPVTSTDHPGERSRTLRTIGSAPDNDVPALLRRVDIVDAVWRGAMVPMLVRRVDIGSGDSHTVELLNCYRHTENDMRPSADFLPSLNIEQARTLFLCDLAFVQEKLRIGSAETRHVTVDIPTNASALATLGSEVRIIAQHTPALFTRLTFTLRAEALAALSTDELSRLEKLRAFGMIFNIRGAGNLADAQGLLPFKAIRLDPSITRGVSKNAQQLAMLRSLLALAHRKGARVIAEGIDHAADFQAIKQEQCHEAQGELIARPLRIEEYRAHMRGASRFAAH